MKKIILISSFVLLASLSVTAQGARVDAQVVQGLETQGFTVQQQQGFIFGYKIVGDVIQAYMNGPTTGWISLGFNPSRRKRDANIIIGFVQNGQANIRNDYGVSDTGHRPVESIGKTSNFKLLEFGEESGRTYFLFEIPLSSGDQFNRPLRRGNTYPVIWAFALNGRKDFTSMHSRKGSFQMTLR